MIISDLPVVLVEEILSRVPAKSLIRIRTTCKQWNTFFKDRGLREKQFHKAEKQSMFLMLKNNKVCSMNVNLNVATPSIEFKGELSIKGSQVDIDSVFHCDGLLLCTTTDYRLVVWNPCLGKTRWIQLGYNHLIYFPTFSLGYINNNQSCRSYKLLRCWYQYKSNQKVLKYEIYEFGSDSWKVFDNVSSDYLMQRDTGVSLKGNTYWLPLNEDLQILLCFDYTTERFKRFCLPPVENVSNMFLSVTREEQLSVLFHRNSKSSEMEIWMAKNINSNIEVNLSWRKSFTMDMEMRNITCCYPNSFLIDEEKRLVVCCHERLFDSVVEIIGDNSEYDTKQFFALSWTPQSIYIFNYVPSLFQIQRCRKGRRGTRKARK